MTINSVSIAIESRSSVVLYDSASVVSDDVIHELVRLATLAPSAYNFQNWKFIAVRSAEAKKKLQAAAYGQRQIAEAAVTFVICGTLRAHESLALMLAPDVEAGRLPTRVRDRWIGDAVNSHAGNDQLQRDEAIRSASLAAMTLMLAAQAIGLSSGPVGGFDAAKVAREFTLSTRDVPVMLVTIGYPAAGNWPQKVRKEVHEVLELA